MGGEETYELDEGFFQAGLAVWLENPFPNDVDNYRMGRVLDPKRSARPVYVPGKVITGMGGGKALVETDWEPKMKVECNTCNLYPANVVQDVDDMVELAHLNDATVLQNVQSRYHSEQQQQIYTMAGPILIAVNPYQIVCDKQNTSIYDDSYIAKYRSAPVVGLNSGLKPSLPPHIYGVASNAVATFLEEKQNQSIVISGESGAGKTESTKQIMQYITSCTTGASKEDGIETKLLRSNPVLEAMGNAKTIRNDNSSRFGKFIQILMEPSSGRNGVSIKGGTIRDYLLEKSRVVYHVLGERNYHIFYQLIDGLSEPDRARLGLGEADSYRYLNPEMQQRHAKMIDTVNNGTRKRRTSSVPSSPVARSFARIIDDKAGFEELLASLKVVGLGGEKQDNLFKTVAGVLHLGNIELFEENEETSKVKNGADNPSIQSAAHLLGLSPEDLCKHLVTRETTTGGSTICSPLDRKRAYDGIDALAKSIYGHLFRWVVRVINETLSEGTTNTHGIGILDIFGFEVFRKNGFEQFCINFANEKLHQLFTTYVFKLEQKMYEEEKIDYSEVRFTDNQDIISIIEKKPVGILSLLDEACLFPRSSDESFLSKLNQTHDKPVPKKQIEDSSDGMKKLYRKGTLKESNYGPSFVVYHSAASVVYTVDEFLVKNRDRLEKNITEMMTRSSSSLISCLFKADENSSESGGGSFTGSNAFLGSKFKDDINKLMTTLHSTTPHFVRCLKANGEKRPNYMDPELVMHQLRYLGVLDSIRIRHSGFSYRTNFSSFYSRFALIVPSMESPATLLTRSDFSEDLARQKCQELVTRLWKMVSNAQKENEKKNLSSPSNRCSSTAITNLKSMIQLGTTRIFLRKQMIQTLEALRDVKLQAMDAAATKIQSLARMRSTRSRLVRVKRGLERIRAAWFALRDREEWVSHWKSQESVRNISKIWIAKTILSRRKRAIRTIQAGFRRAIAVNSYTKERQAVTLIAAFARSKAVRRHIEEQHNAVLLLQASARSFLIRNRIYFRKVRGALLLQGLVRSYQVRQSTPEIQAHLAHARAERRKIRMIRKVQSLYRRRVILRRWRNIMAACKRIQYWSYGFLLRYRFLRMKQSGRLIQRVIRGFISRCLVRRMKTDILLKEENWRVNQIRFHEGEKIKEQNQSRHLIERYRQRPCEVASGKFTQVLGFGKVPVMKGSRVLQQSLDVDVVVDVSSVYDFIKVGEDEEAGKTWLETVDSCNTNSACLIQVETGVSNTVVLNREGEVHTFGFGDRGQNGSGSFRSLSSPTQVGFPLPSSGPSVKISAIAVGDSHALALSTTGQVFSWGAGSLGQLGHADGYKRNESRPRIIETLKKRKVMAIAAGGAHSACLIKNGRSLYTFGGPACCLGQGTYLSSVNSSSDVPRAVKGLEKEVIVCMSSGREFMTVVTKSGKLFSWGKNAHGQLGLGDLKDRFVPRVVAFNNTNRKMMRAVAGGRHTIALDDRGKVYTFGENKNGQLGRKTNASFDSTPGHVKLTGKAIDISAGWRSSAAICEEADTDALLVWGVSNLSNESMENLLTSDVVEIEEFSSPKRIPINMHNCGRKVISLMSTKSHSLSYLGLVYEQKPATVAMYSSPLLPLLRDGCHTTKKPTLEMEDVEDVIVDDKGAEIDMSDLSKKELKALVCSILKEEKMFLQGKVQPKQMPRRRVVGQTTYLEHEEEAEKKARTVKEVASVPRVDIAGVDTGVTSPESSERDTAADSETPPFSRKSSVHLRVDAQFDLSESEKRQQQLELRRQEKQKERECREGKDKEMGELFSPRFLRHSSTSFLEYSAAMEKKKKKKKVVVSPAVNQKIARLEREKKEAEEQLKLLKSKTQMAGTKKFSDVVEEEEAKDDCNDGVNTMEWGTRVRKPAGGTSTSSPKKTQKNTPLTSMVEKLHYQAKIDVASIWSNYCP